METEEVTNIPDAGTTRTSPVLLLDLDGVLNVAPDAGMPDPTGWTQWRRIQQRSDGYRYRVQASVYVCSWIAHLANGGLMDVRWLTSWQADPWALRELEHKLELPWLPFQPTAHLYPARTNPQPGLDWWKWQAVKPLLEAGTPFVWIDDDLSRLLSEAVRAELSANPRVLLVEPDEALGVTQEHIAKVTWFLARNRTDAR